MASRPGLVWLLGVVFAASACGGSDSSQQDFDGDGRGSGPTANPSKRESIDGLDNAGDGIADNHTPQYDDDGDGYSEDQGDCNDDEMGDGALIGPDAIEVNETAEG